MGVPMIKNINLRLFYVFIVFNLLNIQCNAKEESNMIEITELSFHDSILKFNLKFIFNDYKSIYYWRGHIYPALEYILSLSILDDDGKELNTECLDKVLPKVGYPTDFKNVKNFTYPNPLRLLIKKNGVRYNDCINIKVVYDTTNTLHKHLSNIRVESKVYRYCPSKTGKHGCSRGEE